MRNLMQLCWHVAIVCSDLLPLLKGDRPPGLLVRLMAPVRETTLHSKAGAVLRRAITTSQNSRPTPCVLLLACEHQQLRQYPCICCCCETSKSTFVCRVWMLTLPVQMLLRSWCSSEHRHCPN